MVPIFTETLLAVMSLSQNWDGRNLWIFDRFWRWNQKRKIRKIIEMSKDIPITAFLLDDFINVYESTSDMISLKGLVITHYPDRKERLITIPMNAGVNVTISLNDPNSSAILMSLYITAEEEMITYSKKSIGRIDFIGNKFEYTGNDVMKSNVIEVVTDLLHDMFHTYLSMMLETLGEVSISYTTSTEDENEILT